MEGNSQKKPQLGSNRRHLLEQVRTKVQNASEAPAPEPPPPAPLQRPACIPPHTWQRVRKVAREQALKMAHAPSPQE